MKGKIGGMRKRATVVVCLALLIAILTPLLTPIAWAQTVAAWGRVKMDPFLQGIEMIAPGGKGDYSKLAFSPRGLPTDLQKGVTEENPRTIDVGSDPCVPEANVFDDCMAEYCWPGSDSCAQALCQPSRSGCAAPCIFIYTADTSACVGACLHLQDDRECVEPYMPAFAACLGECWSSEKPAPCGYACLATLGDSRDSCRQAETASPTPTSISPPTATPTPTPTSTPTPVPSPTSDYDGDGVPDDEDLCRFRWGTRELGGCPEGRPAAGDLVFRWGIPAWGVWVCKGIIGGYADSEGHLYNFGHVGVYVGDFQADREYEARHERGLEVQRWDPTTQEWKPVTLNQGDKILPGDVVPDAVIEADFDYEGVGLSNLKNFDIDRLDAYGGATVPYYGHPVGGLTPDQRWSIVKKMAGIAGDTEDGLRPFDLSARNCAHEAVYAYTESDAYRAWLKHKKLAGWWTPNYVASWMHLKPFPQYKNQVQRFEDVPREEPGLRPPVGLPALPSRNLTFHVKSPVSLHVYDSSGRHTGPTANGLEAHIPYSEYWELEEGYKILNILVQARDTYRVVIESYGQGSFDLDVEALNYYEANQVHTVSYEQVAIGPQTLAEITLQPNKLPSEGDLALRVDEDGDGQVDRRETPTIEGFTLEAGPTPEPPRPTGFQPLWGLLCATLCGWVLVMGGVLGVVVFARRHRFAKGILIVLVLAAVALMALSCLLAASILLGSKEAVPETPLTALPTPEATLAATPFQTATAPTPPLPTDTPMTTILAPDQIMSTSAEIMSGVSSAHIIFEQEVPGSYTRRGWGDVLLPDQAQFQQSINGGEPVETIVIGATGYWRDDAAPDGWNLGPIAPFASNPARWVPLSQYYAIPIGLADETMNGIDCYHMQFTVNLPPGWLGLFSGGGTGEAWIAKPDYSLVKAIYDLEYQGSRESGSMNLTLDLSELDKPASIVPPK